MGLDSLEKAEFVGIPEAQRPITSDAEKQMCIGDKDNVSDCALMLPEGMVTISEVSAPDSDTTVT